MLEYCYKDDALGDPMVNEYHILAMEWCTKEELDTIAKYAFAVNDFMVKYLKTLNLDLVGLQNRIRPPQRRHHCAGGRNQPRHLPAVGLRHQGKAG